MAHAAGEYPLRSGDAFWINMRGWCARDILPLGWLERSRGEELRADREAAGMLMRAGFDPRALARYLERAQGPENESKATWLPARAERLATIEDAAGLSPRAHAASSEEFLAVQRAVGELLPAGGGEAPSLRRARR
ncbi:MAG: hypothetical protein KIT09_25330 [Bryobacteraceae bacterium]|nr:hypothetical protein [Bryobacteraceae bacterium]